MKVGFVSIIGRPNVGKSTLLNQILDFNLAITSPKPQTTRNKIKGIYNDYDSQIIFVDTPGIHRPKQLLSDFLNENAISAMKEIDCMLFLSPSIEPIGPGDKWIIDKTRDVKNRIAVISKIDLMLDKDKLAEKAAQLKKFGFKEVVGISTEIKGTVNALVSIIKEYMPISDRLEYDKDFMTDLSVRFIAEEYIRESTIDLLYHEIPHSIGVKIEEFNEKEDSVFISASIFVERDSQKGIVIGTNGKVIKQIGVNSRKKIQKLVHKKVFIDLTIKVFKNWTKDEKKIKQMGF